MSNPTERWGDCKRQFNLRLDLGMVYFNYASHSRNQKNKITHKKYQKPVLFESKDIIHLLSNGYGGY